MSTTSSINIQLERELSLLLHQILKQDGFITFHRLTMEIQKSIRLVPLLRAKGITFPYRSLAVVEGVYTIEREAIVTGNLMLLTNPFVTPRDMEDTLLYTIKYRLGSTDKNKIRQFKDFGVGQLSNAPSICELYRDVNFSQSKLRSKGPKGTMWLDDLDILSVLQKQPGLLTWESVYKEAFHEWERNMKERSPDNDTNYLVAVPKVGLTQGSLTFYRQKVAEFTKSAESRFRQALKIADKHNADSIAVDTIPSVNLVTVSSVVATVPSPESTASGSPLQSKKDAFDDFPELNLALLDAYMTVLREKNLDSPCMTNWATVMRIAKWSSPNISNTSSSNATTTTSTSTTSASSTARIDLYLLRKVQLHFLAITVLFGAPILADRPVENLKSVMNILSTDKHSSIYELVQVKGLKNTLTPDTSPSRCCTSIFLDTEQVPNLSVLSDTSESLVKVLKNAVSRFGLKLPSTKRKVNLRIQKLLKTFKETKKTLTKGSILQAAASRGKEFVHAAIVANINFNHPEHYGTLLQYSESTINNNSRNRSFISNPTGPGVQMLDQSEAVSKDAESGIASDDDDESSSDDHEDNVLTGSNVSVSNIGATAVDNSSQWLHSILWILFLLGIHLPAEDTARLRTAGAVPLSWKVVFDSNELSSKLSFWKMFTSIPIDQPQPSVTQPLLNESGLANPNDNHQESHDGTVVLSLRPKRTPSDNLKPAEQEIVHSNANATTIDMDDIPLFIQTEVLQIIEYLKRTVSPDKLRTALRTVISSYFGVRYPEVILPILGESVSNEKFEKWLIKQSQRSGMLDQQSLSSVLLLSALQSVSIPNSLALKSSSVLEILGSVPVLEDAEQWTQWSLLHAPVHGPLACLLRDTIVCPNLANNHIRFLEYPRGVFLRICEQASAATIVHTISELSDPRYAAATIVTFVAREVEYKDWKSACSRILDILTTSTLDILHSKEKQNTDRYESLALFLLEIVGYLPLGVNGILGNVIISILVDTLQVPIDDLNGLIHKVYTQHIRKEYNDDGNSNIISWRISSFGSQCLSKCRPLQGVIAALCYALSTNSSIVTTPTLRTQVMDMLRGLLDHRNSSTVNSSTTVNIADNVSHNASDQTYIPVMNNDGASVSVSSDVSRTDFNNSSIREVANTEIQNTPISIVANDNNVDSTSNDLLPSLGSSLRPQSLVQAQMVINRMREVWIKPVASMDPLEALARNVAVQATYRLSGDLYKEATHFLYEMLQNADDNDYAPHNIATVLLHCESHQFTGNILTVYNNELGFRNKDIEAICQTGGSTKTMAGYIGKKGIGWKSVFAVSREPEVHSGYAHFKFDCRSEIEGGLGNVGQLAPTFIDTEMIPEIPNPIMNAMNNSSLVPSFIPGTIIRLPFGFTGDRGSQATTTPNKQNDLVSFERIEAALSLLLQTPSMLLFMRKLKTISVNIVRETKDGKKQSHMRTLQRQPDEPIALYHSATGNRKHSAYIATVVETDFSNHEGNPKQITHRWLMYHQSVPLEEAPDRIIPVSTTSKFTEVVLAFPFASGKSDFAAQDSHTRNRSTFLGNESQKVFAFLPVDDYGLPFVVQADWILPSTRESIRVDNLWNIWLMNEIFPSMMMDCRFTFQSYFLHVTNSVTATNEISSKAMIAFLCHLPGTNAMVKNDFFHPSISKLYDQLRKIPCLPTFCSENSDVTLAAPVNMISLIFPPDVTVFEANEDPKLALINLLGACGITDLSLAQDLLQVQFLHPATAEMIPSNVLEKLGIRSWSPMVTAKLLAAIYSLRTDRNEVNNTVKKFISWCRLLWVQKASFGNVHGNSITKHGSVAYLLDDNVAWVPISSGTLCSLSTTLPIMFNESKVSHTFFDVFAKMHPTLKLLHPSIVLQFSKVQWLQQCCQWLGVIPLDLSIVMENIIVPFFRSASERTDASLQKITQTTSNPSTSTDISLKYSMTDLVINATNVCRLWCEKNMFTHHPDDRTIECFRKLRSVIVFVTSKNEVIRLKPDNVVTELSVGTLKFGYLHIGTDMVFDEPSKIVLRRLEMTLGDDSLIDESSPNVVWYTVSPLYITHDSDLRPGNAKDSTVHDWKRFFGMFGITDTFHGIMMDQNAFHRSMIIPSSVFQNISPQIDVAAEQDIVESEVVVFIQTIAKRFRNDEVMHRKRIEAAAIAILNSLRIHVDTKNDRNAPLLQWLRDQAWLPIVHRKDEEFVGGMKPTELFNIRLSKYYGNWVDYMDDSSLQKDSTTLSSARASAFDEAIGISTNYSSARLLELLFRFTTESSVEADRIVNFSPDPTAARWITRPTASIDNEYSLLDITKSTICAVGSVLQQVYRLLEEKEVNMPNLPLAIPTHLFRDRSDEYGGPLYCRFTTLSQGEIIHDDGLEGSLKYADVWITYDTGIGMETLHHRNEEYNHLLLYENESPVRNKIKEWSHGRQDDKVFDPTDQYVQNNEVLSLLKAFERLRSNHSSAKSRGDSKIQKAIENITQNICGAAMRISLRPTSIPNDKWTKTQNQCLYHVEKLHPRVIPFLFVATIVNNPAVETKDTSEGIDTSSTKDRYMSNVNTIIPSSKTSTMDSKSSDDTDNTEIHSLPTVLYLMNVINTKFSVPDIIYVMNDNPELVPKLLRYYSTVNSPIHRVSPILLIHLPTLNDKHVHKPRMQSIRSFLYEESSIRAISLNQALKENPPLPGSVRFTSFTNLDRYVWAHVCKSLQYALYVTDNNMYKGIQGIVAHGLKSVLGDTGFAVCSKLEIDFTVDRRLVDDTIVPFIVYKEPCISKICPHEDNWILYVDQSQKNLLTNIVSEKYVWCEAVVHFILSHVTGPKVDPTRITDIRTALNGGFRNIMSELDLWFRSGSTNPSTYPDPPGELWYFAKDLQYTPASAVKPPVPPGSVVDEPMDNVTAAELAAMMNTLSIIGKWKKDKESTTLSEEERDTSSASGSDTESEDESTEEHHYLSVLGEHAIDRNNKHIAKLIAEGKFGSIDRVPSQITTGLGRLPMIQDLLRDANRGTGNGEIILQSNQKKKIGYAGVLMEELPPESIVEGMPLVSSTSSSSSSTGMPLVSSSTAMPLVLSSSSSSTSLQHSISTNIVDEANNYSVNSENRIDVSGIKNKSSVVYANSTTIESIDASSILNNQSEAKSLSIELLASNSFLPRLFRETASGFSNSRIPSSMEVVLANNSFYQSLITQLLNSANEQTLSSSSSSSLFSGENSIVAQATGRVAELLINYILQEEIAQERYPMKLIWVNENSESGKPFDFFVTDESSSSPVRYIEVKGTRKIFEIDAPLQVPISPQEISFAYQNKMTYELYCVTGIGIPGAMEVIRIKNFISIVNQPVMKLGDTKNDGNEEDNEGKLNLVIEFRKK